MSDYTKTQANLDASVRHFTGGFRKGHARTDEGIELCEYLDIHKVLPQVFCYWIVFMKTHDAGPVLLERPAHLLSLAMGSEFTWYKGNYVKAAEMSFDYAMKEYNRHILIGLPRMHFLEGSPGTAPPLLLVEECYKSYKEPTGWDPQQLESYKDIINKYANAAHEDLIGCPDLAPRVPNFVELLNTKNRKYIL